MPRIQLVAADQPLAQRLVEGLRYPLRRAGLATCIGVALSWYLTLLPSILGLVIAVIIWGATFAYAIDCMVLTADGYADPPELNLMDRAGSPRALLTLHVLVVLALAAVAFVDPHALWPWLVVAAILLPAIDMSLAFDGDIPVAFNPLNWVQIATRFGAGYLIPVLANLLVVGAILLAVAQLKWVPTLIALPVLGFLVTYLLLLDFHWMGLLIWHYRERLGMTPEAPRLAAAVGQDADAALVRECSARAEHDLEEAAIRLRDRLRDRVAPMPVHALFRTLLQRLGRDDLLLQHGQTWIAQLCVNGEQRRALGVVQECRGIDPAFIPDDPEGAADLAQLAMRLGMRDLGRHLARTYLQRWPQGSAAERVKPLLVEHV